MRTWTGLEAGTFLAWARAELAVGWELLLGTGMRRGELLALRWRDVDFEGQRISVRRSVGVVRVKGAGERLVEGPTKSAKARVIDVDADLLASLRAHRQSLAKVSLMLAKDESLVLGMPDGTHRHPERFSRRFEETVTAARRELGDDVLSEIRLHDMRHTHAVLLLLAKIHPKVVSERLGHASISITLDIYSHVLPSMQREAADALGAMLYRGSA